MITTHECYYPLYNDKEHFIIIVTGGRGCEDPYTPILMADGNVKFIKDIKVGDKVLGLRDSTRNVLKITTGRGKMYRIHHLNQELNFNDYKVNSTHILTLLNTITNKWEDISIQEALKCDLNIYRGIKHTPQKDYFSKIEITEEGEGDWCGIFIDGDQRYLHADRVVTHNSGKSYSVGTFLERLTFEKNKLPDGKSITHNILSTRYTMSSASISVIPEFMEKVDADGTGNFFHATKTDVTNLVTGAKVMFRGIKTSSGNQTAKLKSIQGITTFVCDEAEEWTSDEEFEKIMFSIRQQGIQNRIIVIMNPTDSNHFIYQKYIKDTHKIVEYDGVPVQISTHPSVLHIHTSYLDNLEHLSDTFIQEARAMKEKDPERYAHIFMGQWSDVAEGAVFKKWGIVDEFPEHCTRVGLGLDFGFKTDPSAAIRCGIIDNRLYLDELFYRTAMLSTDLIRELKAWSQYKIIADSADPRLIQEIANAGLLIYPVMKGAGSILAGLDKMQTLEIYVTKRSINLQEELRNYTWDKDKDGNYINKPIDAYNHCFVGETLVETRSGGKPIKDIREGEEVLTSDGFKPVTRFFDNDVKDVVEYELIYQGGSIRVTATPDHKVKTTNGWKEISKLRQTDEIYLCKYLTGKNTTFTGTKNISREDAKDCTLRYGGFTTEKFPKVITFTTKMGIPTTMIYPISNCWAQRNTSNAMLNNKRQAMAIWNVSAHEWTMQGFSQASGINPMKGENGIGSMVSSDVNTIMFANNAGMSLCLPQNYKNIVQTLVNPQQEEPLALTTKREYALFAENLSLSGNIFAESVAEENVEKNCSQYVEKKKLEEIRILSKNSLRVYDIEVADMHEFFANGLLVHNCIDAARYWTLGELLGQIMLPKKIDTSKLGIF